MINYAKNIPNDRNNNPLQDYPPAASAISRYSSENSSASSVITLNDNTSVVEVAASNGGAVIRWVGTGDTIGSVISIAGATANFDHYIPSNDYRKFVVPRETQGVQSVVGINIQAGLYRRLAVKSIGVASVLTTEY